MNSTTPARVLSLDEAAAYRPQQVVELSRELAAAKHQLDWFKRQVFGTKSERRIIDPASGQMSLGEMLTPEQPASSPALVERPVAAHTRRPTTKTPESGDDSLPFFDAARVPVEIIELTAPETEGLAPDDFEIISYKNSYRLAQRPGSTVVLNYRRPVIKLKENQAILCPAAPAGVIEGSRADVSFLAGLLIDKFASIRDSRVKAMDETPIKAGCAGPGKLKAAYFWPVYGELDEVCFPFFDSRRIEHVEQALGLTPVERGVLLSDGYTAYAHYTQKTGLTHAQCWAHTRRKLFEAKDIEPAIAAQGLELIGGLYAVEERIRAQKLGATKKLDYRLTHAKPIVEQFFAWVNRQFEAQGLLPSNPMTKALAYARERRFGLEVYLTDPDVPIDTNHLERALRAVPMGKKNWMFCWTELGAKHVGIMQSLIVTCRLHGIDPYDYLVDVLQRVGQHPASRVHELTPKLWKTLFADNPLRSPLHSLHVKTSTSIS